MPVTTPREPLRGRKPGGGRALHLTGAPHGPRRVPVWDAPTRLFHWVTALLVLAAYLTWRVNWMDWHALAGDALLALVLFRLLWGLFGSETARFRHFLKSPPAALRYLAHFARREPDLQVGHNPAGGWMVVLLLALLFGQALTGLYVDNEVANQGPMSGLTPAPVADMITALHDRVFWYALLAAVALHVLAILAYGAVKRHNLLVPMITGCKLLPQFVPAPRLAGPMRALVCLACAIAATAALALWL